MQPRIVRTSKLGRQRQGKDERGIALLTTLLLLLLLTALSLAMVVAAGSDMMINGNYRDFRGSFYAADSGLAVARQDMMNQLAGSIPATFSITTQPIPNGTDGNVLSYITQTYGGSYHPITGNGAAASSWPEKYKITAATFSQAQCTVLGGTGTCSVPTGAVTGYQYIFNYSLTAVGQARGGEAATVSDRGSVIVNANLVAASSTTSFAGWGMFIDNSPICNGTTLVPGTISGPVFTNGAWNFGTNGSYIFTDSVGSVNADAGFQFGGNTCDQKNATSDKNGNTTIAPTFSGGFNRGQNSVPLPVNDFNQKRAVLDGMGSSNSPVTKQDLNNNVKNASGAPYPNSGANSGVFLPYSIDSSGNKTFTGGGIYVEGDAQVRLSPSGANGQTYTITQNGVVSTITITPAAAPCVPNASCGAGTTVFTTGSNSVTISGVPALIDPVTHATTADGAMLYVNGNITSLSGPGQGQAAINDGTALTITAANNVTITGDILYKSEPVTLTQTTQNGQSIPADTLIPANNHQQALGIFTATGDIQMSNGQSNGNLEIDASLATISQGGSGGLTNTGNQINTLTIVGGRIQNNIKNINTVTRNVFFDRRFGGSFSPPFFPSTTLTNGSISSTTPVITTQRVQWVDQSSY